MTDDPLYCAVLKGNAQMPHGTTDKQQRAKAASRQRCDKSALSALIHEYGNVAELDTNNKSYKPVPFRIFAEQTANTSCVQAGSNVRGFMQARPQG